MTPDDGFDDVFTQLGQIGYVPIVTVDRCDQAASVATSLLAGGIPCVEITFRTAVAADAIATIVEAFPDMLVGAGTVLTVDQADAAHEAGARFVVTPGFDDEIVDRCRELRMPIAPGVMTPTEITRALASGLSVVKFFPAEAAGGAAALRAITAPFRDLRFMPTGGIGPEQVADYLTMPSVIACGGSWVATTDAIERNDGREIERRAAEVAGLVRAARTPG